MKALLIKKTAYIGSYFACAVLMEVILFGAMGFGSFAEYFWLNLAALTMLCLIIFIIPSFTVQAILILALLLLQTVLGFVNEYLSRYSQNIFSIDMLSLAKEVGGAFDSSWVSFPLLFGMLAVVLLECGVLFILRRYRTLQNFRLRCTATLLFVFCFMQIAASSVYNLTIESFASEKIDDEYYVIKSDSYLYDTFYVKQKAYKKFGTFAFYFKNIGTVLSELAPLSEEEQYQKRLNSLSEISSYFTANQDQNSQTDSGGAFSGSNLIMVMIESGEWYGINEDYTPTLYALANSGIKMDNYHARNKTNHSEALSVLGSFPKESVFSPNIFYKYTANDNMLDFSLANVLKRDGYVTSYLHNNFHTFYDRDVLMPAFGFENTYFLEEMSGLKGSGLMPGQPQKVKFNDLDSDRAMIETNLDKIVPEGDAPFFSYLTTITMHGGYEDLITYGDYPFSDETDEAIRHRKMADFTKNCEVKDMEEYYALIKREHFDTLFPFLEDNGYSPQEIETMYLRYKRYQAAYMDLDRGMQTLLEHLESTGKLQNTTIAMFADHNAYFNTLNYSLKNVPEHNYFVPSVYNIPFYIYNGGMPLTVSARQFVHAPQNIPPLESRIVSRFTNSFDIVPTLLDLYGYKFNTALYHGSSVFSDQSGIFVSMEAGYFDDKFYSADGSTDGGELLYGQGQDDIQKKEFTDKVIGYINRQNIFERIYKYDYFRYAEEYGFKSIDDLIYKSI